MAGWDGLRYAGGVGPSAPGRLMSARALLTAAACLALAAPAQAQQPQSDQAIGREAAALDQPSSKPAKAPNTSAPVVVTGRTGKPCSANDQQCIHDVSLELWRKYPKQIDALCGLETMHALQTGMLQEQLGYTMNPGDGAGPVGLSNHMTPQTQALCQFRATHAKELAEPAEAARTAR
jgi:hypothetical protein